MSIEEEFESQQQDIFQKFLERQKSESKFIRFEDGEVKVMRFDRDKEAPISRSRVYGTVNMDFTVYYPVGSTRPKIWSPPIATAKKEVVPLLQQGLSILEVGRYGTGKDETRYWVRGIL
jgi:hypothetical protein